jgi:hypothetical protein
MRGPLAVVGAIGAPLPGPRGDLDLDAHLGA